MRSGKLIRIGEQLVKKLEQIMQQEEERGNVNISYNRAGEILARRIDAAGGLREWKETQQRKRRETTRDSLIKIIENWKGVVDDMRKGRVTIRKVGGGYDISINGVAVEFAKNRGEAQMKANRIRDMQGKYPHLNRLGGRK